MKIKSLQASATEGHFVQFLNMLPDLENLDLKLILQERTASPDESILLDEAWQQTNCKPPDRFRGSSESSV